MRFDRCPKGWLRDEAVSAKRLVDDATRYLLRGTLPRAGGYEDQSPMFCASVLVVDDVLVTLRRAANGNG